MSTPVIADCAGLWRRSVLIEADGSRDTSAGVLWLQGITAYVDSRGFAGRLGQRGDVFEWRRDVDLEPPGPFPDAGTMHWDGDVLVETGVHEQYAEHWVRDEAPAAPCGAVFLHAPDGADGLLLRVGASFGWAGAGAVVIGDVGGSQWNELEIESSGDDVRAAGVRWGVAEREGNINP
jgi:hypothetical protein